MVNDQVGHDFDVLAQRADIIPIAKARIDATVIDWIESRIGAVDGVEKWKQMNTAEDVFQTSEQKFLEFAETSSGEMIDVRNQLCLIFHGLQNGSPAGIHSTGTSEMNDFSQSAQRRMP